MSEAKFQKAVEIVKNLPKDGPVQLSTDVKLVFYKLYKQATEGDVNTARPGMLNFEGKAKWDAWNDVKGTSKEDARAKYVEELLKALKANDDADSKKYVAELEATA
ncbi:Acbp from Moniliophthora Perniciosa [Pterulicium gracile]|uniref:Acbp from Moniliophthora Perniciosa n=1 Tax=Pterulicium gracile TaxID=1884261 RepID=A0A5C3QG19_9AGAR|nr:Acbp from Moniliophthora Perniciosa [Pterula gracilis]